jgi:ferredoxin
MMVISFTPINERLCVIRIKDRFFNLSLINIHAPTNDSEEEAKDQFNEQLERAYAACPSHAMKLVMGDANAKTTVQTTSGYVSSQERGTVNQQKPSAGKNILKNT